jgi:hypothetical protein
MEQSVVLGSKIRSLMIITFDSGVPPDFLLQNPVA